ncbi:MAG: aminopeptidase [Deltaproteobacteria bacterium]|nr:aminopeptidase [Deltaproteobacteria bacterium]
MRPWVLALGLAAPLLSGCLEFCYLGQAAAGQDAIWADSRPIEEAVADPRVPPETRAMLALVSDVKRYGETQGLAPTASYREYVDLRREAVVWVVTASHPLRFEPVTWRFPVVGEVPYLGWFDRADAERLARGLREAGKDVHLREARAYSTLGWFRDPVLSTMLKDGPEELVDVVLHESMHATHYVPSQTVYNESLANFVATKLTERYLRDRLGASPYRLHDHREREHTYARRVERLHATHDELERLYASPLDDEAKLARKRAILDAVQRELGLAIELNNAALLQARAYDSGAAGFEALLAACGDDMRRFVTALKRIGPDVFPEPDAQAIDGILRARAARGCDAP